MKILFLDQSGKLGGAELSLADVAKPHRDNCRVGLFADGPFRELLEKQKIPVQIFTNKSIKVNKNSNLLRSLASISTIIPLIIQVAGLAKSYDIIYANTQKALVIGSLASMISRRPLVYHLRDILCSNHFSPVNRKIAVTLANRFASLVITNSQATQSAFIEAGGRKDITEVVYNGFEPEQYSNHDYKRDSIREKLGLQGKYVVGHFSRLAPWKGQHILIEALQYCPENVSVILVGDALFGEKEYVEKLRSQVKELKLENRVHFLGFCLDVVPYMLACDLVTHTSIAPEPFGRVIIEAMLCGRAVIGAKAGGVLELIESEKTGLLVQPGDSKELASAIARCYRQPDFTNEIVKTARLYARSTFHLSHTNRQINSLLQDLYKLKPLQKMPNLLSQRTKN